MVAVGLSVPTGRAVGTVVVDAFEVLVLAAACPPQAARRVATATDETYTRAADERNLSMRMAGAWICEWRFFAGVRRGPDPGRPEDPAVLCT